MFVFRLALALGRTVQEIEAIGMSELMEWVAYFELMDKEGEK